MSIPARQSPQTKQEHKGSKRKPTVEGTRYRKAVNDNFTSNELDIQVPISPLSLRHAVEKDDVTWQVQFRAFFTTR